MYKQIKAYEAKTGQSAYVQMKGESTFPEYFARRSAAFQKEWLGPARYRMYADGYALWVVWQGEANPVVFQFMQEYGGLSLEANDGQALLFFFSSNEYIV